MNCSGTDDMVFRWLEIIGDDELSLKRELNFKLEVSRSGKGLDLTLILILVPEAHLWVLIGSGIVQSEFVVLKELAYNPQPARLGPRCSGERSRIRSQVLMIWSHRLIDWLIEKKKKGWCRSGLELGPAYCTLLCLSGGEDHGWFDLGRCS